MYQIGKTKQIVNEMCNYGLDILGIAEARWTGFGEVKTTDGYSIVYSGHEEKHERGVALIMSKKAKASLISWAPVSDRIIKARFYSRHAKLTIIQVYAPTNEADEEQKARFYDQLQRILDETHKHDILLLMGDLNAKIGKRVTHDERAIGSEAIGDQNENGELFTTLCEMNDLSIGGSFFKHKDIHKITWISPNGKTGNQIDHIAINSSYKRSLQDVRVKRGADVASDHFLLIGILKLKLSKIPGHKKNKRIRYNIEKLNEPDFKRMYKFELHNRFAALADLVEENEEEVEIIWKKCKETYNKTAEDILGISKGKTKSEWISGETLKLVEERRNLKGKINSTKSERIRQKYQQQYKEMHKNVKRSARSDKRNFYHTLAEEAQRANDVGDIGEVYKIIKKLGGGVKPNAESAIKDKNGKLLTQEKEIASRWKEHFEELLNVTSNLVGSDLGSPFEHQVELDVEMGDITVEEIKNAIKSQKNRRTGGNDYITAELIKADIDTSAAALHKLFNVIWNEEKVPLSWKESQIVKIPKKGNLTECNNWRGISLLSVPGKIFSRVIINRIKKKIDDILRVEQTGFRSGKSTVNQIFVLRNIIEQCVERNETIYFNFIDFSKAFDSIDRECLWKILGFYGIPKKIISIIKEMYNGSSAQVLVNGELTGKFEIKTGVKQGCVLSGLLFIIVLDWVMRKTVETTHRGIRWDFNTFLEDLDFADDIVLMSSRFQDMQEKTSQLEENAKKVGLTINENKTKVMKINSRNRTKVIINSKEIEETDSFTYLGSIVDTLGGTDDDIKCRIKKAQNAFRMLFKVWKSSNLNVSLKLKIYNAIVKSILLYGSETWKITKQQENKLNSFNTKCLRKILKIYWPEKISNNDLYKKTASKPLANDIMRKRWHWIGHVLRRGPESNERIALTWSPDGKRKRGRPRLTWRRHAIKERDNLGWPSWTMAREAALDRKDWVSTIAASCAYKAWRVTRQGKA